jgi:hypothetical protein
VVQIRPSQRHLRIYDKRGPTRIELETKGKYAAAVSRELIERRGDELEMAELVVGLPPCVLRLRCAGRDTRLARRPGSVKSAVLARLTVLTDPVLRPLVPLTDRERAAVPPVGSGDVAVDVRGKRLEDVVADLRSLQSWR